MWKVTIFDPAFIYSRYLHCLNYCNYVNVKIYDFFFHKKEKNFYSIAEIKTFVTLAS